MNNPVIQLEQLDFRYDKVNILQNVNLTVSQGEFIGIFGPNGGGKTTFLKLLMGFLKPSNGHIRLFGSAPKFQRKKIGYVPQIALFDRAFPLSVFELVLMGCMSQARWWGGLPRSAKHKAKEILSWVGLEDKIHAPFGTLSGGQAQRALIARAIASSPELLLLDEPTASIDPEAENLIVNLLMELKGVMTILMVTHDLEGIIKQADRLLCVNHRVSFYDPPALCDHFTLGLYHTPLVAR